MKKRTIAILTLSLLLLIVGTVWAFRSRSDAQLVKVRAMGKELFEGKGPPDREKFDAFRREVEQLRPEQRGQLMQERERRMDAEIARFFQLSPQQRNDYLDQRIQEEEQRHKEHERQRAQAGQQAQATGQPGPGPNANFGPPGRQNRSLDENTERRNARLDHSTPEQRARRTAFHAAMDQRRKQLGLPTHPGPGGPGWR
jgi:hypothetical protein